MQKVLEGRNYDLILTGRQAQDTDAGLTPPMLAEFLGLPQVTNIIRFSDVSDQKITLYRQGDHATEVLEMNLPGVVTVNDSLNEPRLASMRGIMMAKKKPLEEVDLDALGFSAEMMWCAGFYDRRSYSTTNLSHVMKVKYLKAMRLILSNRLWNFWSAKLNY